MKIRRTSSVVLIALAGIVLSGCWESREEEPAGWKQLVRTKGQYYPVPAQWLATEEARIAHDLVLPDSIPKPVPFDFDKADGPWFWPKGEREVAHAYFDHLCRTEAGEWILESPKDVDGYYVARPPRELTEREASHRYNMEAPFVEKDFTWIGSYSADSTSFFANPPYRNYQFVEEPRGQFKWQQHVEERYVRIYSSKSIWEIDDHGNVKSIQPMPVTEVVGIDHPTTRFAFTWRGITRPLDRRYRIAGGELIVYERESRKVIAVSRTFQLGRLVRKNPTVAFWIQSPACREGIWPGDLFVPEFIKRVLQERPIAVYSQNKGNYLWQPRRSKKYMNFH